MRNVVSAPVGESDCLRDKHIRDAIHELSPAQREVVRLRCHGWRLCEIAEATGRSPDTVRQHWYRAKAKLDQALGTLR
ncbi:MAG: sigma-70 family RNA polymerase sigma factor [Gemmatimonadales bacterium]|nr:MAG: sigma-70 family RNA polymerase sigma factor [Gemmatimonadales bacterium]